MGLSPAYVLDRMEGYEIRALFEHRDYKGRTGWEQTRLMTYVIAQTNSRDKLTLSDIMEFPWEKNKEENDEDEIETFHRLKAKAKAFEQYSIKHGAD